MRRVGGTATAKVSATGAVLVALLAGCVTQAANAPSPGATALSATADPSGATVTVCKQIRSDLGSRMSSLGEALGDYLGYRAADDDDAADDARAAVTAQVKELGAAISRVGRAANDISVRTAASKASAAVDRVAVSSDFFSDLDSLSDIPAAIDKISDAAQPITDACS
jgi:hypothetical protein